MQLVDARRLMGPNVLSRSPRVIVELAFGPSEAGGVDAYRSELGRMRSALGWSAEVALSVHPLRGGAVVAYPAPIDVMLACTEMSEWAALSACELVAGGEPCSLEPKRTEIEAMLRRDRSPALLELQAEAERRGLPLLWDDDAISVGLGARSACWPRAAVPAIADVPWEALGTIPVALVTGTNGKTTSTRLLSRIAREAGLRVGSSSSDEIVVGAEVLDTGDWTGPAAARTVLRHPGVDLAVLETARGGILRRGLAMPTCDAALITNVADDHLGGYGVDDLAAMTRVKAVIAEAVRPGGTVVLNAHDPNLVALAGRLDRDVTFFANLERDDASARAVIAGRRAVFAERGRLFFASGGEARAILELSAIPIAFGGAAPYNVENAAGAAAMAYALGIGEDAIVRGLSAFQPSDNPRRGELVERRGVRVLLDFGHNPDGIRAVLRLVAGLRAERPGRLTIVAGTAGDRTERDIEEVAEALLEAKPDRVLLRDLVGYLRGRAPGEVPALFARALASRGFAREAVTTVASEVEALRIALADARPGDFVVVLVFLEHAEVHAFLDSLA